jgi:hypothetical protein
LTWNPIDMCLLHAAYANVCILVANVNEMRFTEASL